MTDYTELKRLAEAATPGPWKAVDYGDYSGDGVDWYVDTTEDSADIMTLPGEIAPNYWSSERAERDMKFIAAANPAAILALIAENERLLTLLARMVDQQVPLTELEGVPGWDRAVELVEVVTERDSLKLEAENLRTVQRASFNASGQIKAAASELGFNPAQEEWALEFLIGLAREVTGLREKCARLEEDNEAMWDNPGDLL